MQEFVNNILFVIPKNKSRLGPGMEIPYYPHLGIAYLMAILKKHGYGVQVFDAGLFDEYEGIDKIVKKSHPILIGVTACSYSYSYVLEVINLLKGLTNTPIVVGGPHVTATRKKILQDAPIDFGIMGEGELTIIQLLEALLSNSSDFSMIRGLIWRKGEEIIENVAQILIQDLDSLPYPDFESFELYRYPCFKHKSLPFLTERGCPYPCSFCAMRKTGFRPRSPDNIVSELEYRAKRNFKHFDINDDVFNLEPERVMTICNLINERGLHINYDLYNGIRANLVTLEMLQKLKNSGCSFICYGLESGNSKTLETIQKNLATEQLEQAAKWTKQVEIPFAVNFIIGHPGETFKTAMDSVRFARRLPATWVNFYNLIPFPGTPVFDWVIKNGRFLIPIDSLFEISNRDNKPVFETDEFTVEERIYVVKHGTRLYNLGALKFRFGKIIGLLLYKILQSKSLLKFGRYFFTRTRLGKKIYYKLRGQTHTLIKTLFWEPFRTIDHLTVSHK